MNSPEKFWFLFGGLWFGVGSVFAVVGAIVLWQESAREARLARDAASASAVVLAKDMRGGDRQESTFRIEYRFTAADGSVIERRAEVEGASWRALAEGDSFQVRYAPDAPHVHALPGESRAESVIGPVFAVVGALFAVSGAVILWRTLARRALLARLAAEGLRADAEVVEVGPTNFRINRVPQWAIWYRYRDHAGNVHDGKTAPMAQEEARRWQPGDRGRVLFDARRPQRGVWVGKG